jgi:hypothetical protein
MHEYANTAKVKLEYYTMSQLFQLTTGQNPDGYDVNY